MKILQALSQKIFRHPNGWVVAAALLISTTVISTYFYYRLQAGSHFRDILLHVKYGGTLAEDLGFLALLAAEAEIEFGEDFRQRDINQIRTSFLELKTRIEELGSSTADHHSTSQAMLHRLADTDGLDEMNLDDLGLVAVKSTDLLGQAYVQSSAAHRNSSFFTYLPINNVDISSGKPVLSRSVWRDLLFARSIEPILLEAAEIIEDSYQVYYIPLSGFVQTHAIGAKDQHSHYRGKFPEFRSFSDRNYFKKAMASEDRFHITNPYIDVAGGGLVRTYSVCIENKHLGMIGMVGVDERLEPLRPFAEDLSLGSGVFKDFHFGTYAISSGRLDRRIRNSEILAGAFRDIDEDPSLVLSGINRWPAEGSAGTILFTFPLGTKNAGRDEIGYFLFEPTSAYFRDTGLFIAYCLSILCIIAMIVQLLFFRFESLQAERRQTEIISGIHGGFVVVDAQGAIVKTNENFFNIVKGLPGAYTHCSDFLSEESHTEFRQLQSQDSAAQGFEFPGSVRRPDGRLVPAIVASAPISFQDVDGARMILIIPSRELEITIASKFLHGFSHSLKTPVHSMLLLADRFRRKKAFPKFDHYFKLMQIQINEFSLMVNNVLRFSKLELKEQEVRRRPEDVATLLRSVLSPVRDRAASKGLKVSENIAESLKYSADKELLRVVFNNIIDNALKYTSEGTIAISARDFGTEIIISFEDSGHGVRPEERKHIFERFYRSSEASIQRQEGLGIGLYVSRKYIQMHDGLLTYEPVVDHDGEEGKQHGSRFTITLPK